MNWKGGKGREEGGGGGRRKVGESAAKPLLEEEKKQNPRVGPPLGGRVEEGEREMEGRGE